MTTPGSDQTVPAGAEPDVPAATPAESAPAVGADAEPPGEAEPDVPAGAEAPAAPPSGPRRPLSNAQRIAVVAAVGVAAVGIGGGVVYASSHQSTDPAHNGAGMRVFHQGGNDGLANALHGEYVASDGKGGTTTMLIQTGTVTAVSAGSLSVRSTDGFTGTYTVGSKTKVDDGADTIGTVKNGHTVTVVATKSDRSATSVLDTTLLGKGFQGGGPQNNVGQQGGSGQQGTGPKGRTGQGNAGPGGAQPGAGAPGGA